MRALMRHASVRRGTLHIIISTAKREWLLSGINNANVKINGTAVAQ